MKIGIIEPVGAHGGNDIYDLNLLSSLGMQYNTEATLFTCNETKFKQGLRIKLFYKNIYGDRNKFFRILPYLQGTFKSLLYAKKNKIDIIHLHFFGFNSLEYFNLYLAKIVFSFKVVGTIHDIEPFEKYPNNSNAIHSYKKFIKLMDGIVVHTDYAREELLNKIGTELNSHKKIKKILACDLDYSTLNNNYIDKSMARDKLALPKDRNIILFFGQIKKVKGLDVLLKAMSNIKKHDSEILLLVAGKVWKDDFSKYENLIKKHSLDYNIDLRIDFVNNNYVQYYFNAVDLIILPYKKNYNSGVLIRAMSFATPVIASGFGPFSEFIDNTRNGFLFETGDETALASTIIDALKNKEELKKIGQMGKQFIKKEFSLQEIGKQYKNFYEQLK